MPQLSKLTTSNSLAFTPMLDLFQHLRQAGMQLTIEQYDLARQALAEGYGGVDWEDLRDVCRTLWVKPSLNYDVEVFEQAFDEYEEQYQQRFSEWLNQQKPQEQPVIVPSREIPLGQLPKIPRRQLPGVSTADERSKQSEPSGYGIDAVKHDHSKSRKRKPEYVVEVPISQEMVRRSWRSLRRPVPDARLQELDVAATVERIGREGVFTDLVQRPIFRKKADLLLLVDDSNAMFPFAPVVQPLTEMVIARRIAPAQLYRFKQCPIDHLYDWQCPLRGISLAKVFGRLHRLRTVVMIVSDAGAASPVYSQERVTRTGRFLARLLPCVREVLWLNPLPQARWAGTTAEPIQVALAGRMVPFDGKHVQRIAQIRKFQSEVQLWPLMQP